MIQDTTCELKNLQIKGSSTLFAEAIYSAIHRIRSILEKTMFQLKTDSNINSTQYTGKLSALVSLTTQYTGKPYALVSLTMQYTGKLSAFVSTTTHSVYLQWMICSPEYSYTSLWSVLTIVTTGTICVHFCLTSALGTIYKTYTCVTSNKELYNVYKCLQLRPLCDLLKYGGQTFSSFHHCSSGFLTSNLIFHNYGSYFFIQTCEFSQSSLYSHQ